MLESLQEHEVIVDALQKGDVDGAEKIIRCHVTIQGEKFHQLMAGMKPD
jgi:DNA-binding GntR family transcriptional regulator